MLPIELLLLHGLGALCGDLPVGYDDGLRLRLHISCIESKHRDIVPNERKRWPWSQVDDGHDYVIDWSKRRG